MSQIRRNDQPVLAPSQRSIEDVEFFLIVRLGSNHLITSFTPLLECRPHLRCILTKTGDKNVITMHRPRDGAQLVVEAATLHNANSETATDEPLSQLISPRRCSWASSVQCFAQLPNMCRSELGKYISRQLNKVASLLFSVQKTLAGHQTQLRRCLHSRLAGLRVQLKLSPSQIGRL